MLRVVRVRMVWEALNRSRLGLLLKLGERTVTLSAMVVLASEAMLTSSLSCLLARVGRAALGR